MQAVKNIENLDKSSLLGYMAFYHIPEMTISHTDLEQIFANNSMDKKHLPDKIQEHDAFRRATGKVKGTISVTMPDGSHKDARLNIDEVRNDSNEIIRLLGRKIIDEDKQDVEYAPAGKFIFDKSSKNVVTTVNPSTFDEYDYRKILNDTVNTYEEWTKYHTKDTVRAIINKVVKSMQPVTIIKGAYFVPRGEYDILKGLQGVIKDLAPYSTAETPGIEIIPLLDTVEQRTMIEDRANKEIMSDVDGIMHELAEMLTQGKDIHSRTIKRIAVEFQDLQDKTTKYSQLLESKMLTVQQQLLTAIDKFSKLQAEKEGSVTEE